MQPVTEDFWLSYHRSSPAVRDRDLIVRSTVQSSARAAAAPFQSAEAFQIFLLSATPAVQQRCVPFLGLPAGKAALVEIWRACQNQHAAEDHLSTHSSVAELFEEKLFRDPAIRDQLRHLEMMVEDQKERLSKAENDRRAAAEIAVTLEAAAKAEEMRRKRTWRDVPADQLAERLSKGEIIGRDEWIPGLTGDRRDLAPPDAREHLNFGKKIHEEANELYREKDFSKAMLRYRQGANLLNWVKCSKDADVDAEMEKMHLTFLKNEAQAALVCQEWQQAKSSCEEALKLDPHDEKSLYRLAKSLLALGDLTGAKAAALRLLKSPFVTADGVLAGKAILQELRRVTADWKRDLSRILPQSCREGTFSTDREAEKPEKPPAPDAPLTPPAEPLAAWLKRRQPLELKPPPLLAAAPGESLFERETMKELLEALLAHYTSPEVEAVLNGVRRAADFEERRILIRSKAVLPSILGPFLEQWEVPGATVVEKKKTLEREVFYWQARDQEVRELAAELYSVFLGETVD